MFVSLLGEMGMWRDAVGLLRPATARKPKWRTKIREIEGKRKPQAHSCNIHIPVWERGFLPHLSTWHGFLLLGSLSTLSLSLSCCHLIFLLLLFSLSYIIFVVLRLTHQGWGSPLLSFSHTAILICPPTFHHSNEKGSPSVIESFNHRSPFLFLSPFSFLSH